MNIENNSAEIKTLLEDQKALGLAKIELEDEKSVYDVVVCQSQPREFPQITPVVKQKVGGWLIQMCNAIKSFFTRGFKSACEQKTSAVQTKSTPFLNMMSRAGSDHQPTPVVPGA